MPGSEFPLGASRVGGRPDLPAGMEWPQCPGWGQLAKRSLRFIAQFDLADLARFPACADLPARGLLSFFYGVECDLTWGGPHEQGRWRVIHSESSRDLARLEFPPDIEFRYSPCKPILHETLSLPDWATFQMDRLRECLDDAESDRYGKLLYEFETSEAEFPYRHQLMGIPQVLQGMMETECQ